VAATTVPEPASHDDRFPRFAGRVAWLGRHRRGVMVLAVASITGALLLDVAIPSYPIAGFYLIPVTLAALTLRVRITIVVSAICLGLALYVMTMQGEMSGPAITVVCFTVLGAAGLIGLAYLFKQLGRLYESERSTTERLKSLAEQLQTLQEVVVLDIDRPRADLLSSIVERASQLMGSDGCCVYRLDAGGEALLVAASAGIAPLVGDILPLAAEQDPVARAFAGRRPVSAPDEGDTLLAVPLLVRGKPYGVLALEFQQARPFTDVDVRLAASFGGQVALAIENARLRDELEEKAVAGERSRLARDLHDSVTQSLFAASLKAGAVRRRWSPESSEAQRNLEDVELLTRGALAAMRTLLLEMLPERLEEASLATLLEHLVAAAAGRMLVNVDFAVTGSRQLPPDVTSALYRIAQEALVNVDHHSGAATAWVMLDVSGPVATLEVGDSGVGFDVAAVPPERLGLSIMRERAETAGVRLTVTSGVGRGTAITAEWPTADPDGGGPNGEEHT
jgi:signal transduction histidine kinase